MGAQRNAPRTFQRSLRAFPFVMHPSQNQDHNENGDKIFLPATALEELVRQNIQYPMLFQLQNQNKQRNTHCGVLEFSAEEGKMYMPYWMMNNLLLSPGDIVTILSVSLPKATYTKLQPQENSFLKISNPKAVLEHELRKFSCLTKGDQITITYDNTKYNIEIKELKPANACSIIETDCQVDFEAPPNWGEEEAKWKAQADAKKEAEAAAASSSSSSSSSSSTTTVGDSKKGATEGQMSGKRKADGTPGKEKVGTLDLAKLAAERAARKAQLTSPQHISFTGHGRRVDGRPQKKKSGRASTAKSGGDDAPPPAPQALPVSFGAPKPGASTNRAQALSKFRKRKEAGAFTGSGNTM